MASHVAIASTCEAIVRLLRAGYNPAEFNNAALEFQVYVADNFLQPMEQGVSLLLYRIYHNTSMGSTPGRLLSKGGRTRSQLPIDLHFLLTAWAKTASRQHEIAGWMMRVMEDNATLPASLLNAYQPDVFRPDEALEVSLADLTTEDLFRIWEVMINHVYQLSVPYAARLVQLESAQIDRLEVPVVERLAPVEPIEWRGVGVGS
jgi:hypothetical protein